MPEQVHFCRADHQRGARTLDDVKLRCLIYRKRAVSGQAVKVGDDGGDGEGGKAKARGVDRTVGAQVVSCFPQEVDVNGVVDQRDVSAEGRKLGEVEGGKREQGSDDRFSVGDKTTTSQTLGSLTMNRPKYKFFVTSRRF